MLSDGVNGMVIESSCTHTCRSSPLAAHDTASNGTTLWGCRPSVLPSCACHSAPRLSQLGGKCLVAGIGLPFSPCLEQGRVLVRRRHRCTASKQLSRTLRVVRCIPLKHAPLHPERCIAGAQLCGAFIQPPCCPMVVHLPPGHVRPGVPDVWVAWCAGSAALEGTRCGCKCALPPLQHSQLRAMIPAAAREK